MEESIELTDFPILCRICLEKREHLISVFQIFNLEDKTYQEMLKECASVNIFENDSLPKNLCLQCSQHLVQSYKLKLKCISSEKRLQTLVENSQNKIKEEETIVLYEILDNDFDFHDDDDNKEHDFNHYYPRINYSTDPVEYILIEEDTDDFPHSSSNSKKSSKVVNYKCTDCEASFTSTIKLFDHAKDVHSKSVVQCEFCKTDFNRGKDFKTHCSGPSVCKWCLKDCGCFTNLIEHKQKHNVCDKCGKTFNNVEACRKHMQIHKEKGYLCAYCGKSFRDRSNMTSHTRTHTGEKPYQCKLCDAKFKDSCHLKFHMTKHSKEKKYECDICNAKYKWIGGLKQHKLSQHTDGEFACSYCDKRCKTKKYLQKHQLVHSGEWNLVCTYCNKLFNRKDNLKVHLRIHTGEKPFVCNKCGRGFSAKHVLNGHMKTCNIKNNI
ncbi:zinc finger protein 91-like [Chrysoperla carnea]|uniref:zinc finger protein 91-like n=1 Tax=Chrysoperla carnea TaxID=189513 RepID=UPI001D09220D|nr:zinc finger protein 91-like [Chrysoperla carnea]